MSRYKQPYSLYKRGKYWYYRTYTPDDVRTSGKTTGCTSKSAAKMYCDKLYKDGELCKNDISYAKYTEHFFDADGLYFTDRQKKVSPQTISQYKSVQKNHLLPYFGKKKLCDINYTTLKKFRLYLYEEKGFTDKTVILIFTQLKIVITYAYRDRIIFTNPFQFLEPVKLDTSKVRDAFTLEEVKTLYNSIGDTYKNQILLMALTGMRIKESIAQSETDIIHADNFDYILCQWQQYQRNSKLPVKRNSVREIPIIPEIKELMFFNWPLEDFYAAAKPIKDSFKDSEQRKLSFHSLRHFFITNSKSEGITPIKVEYMAGHSLKGMENVYTNFKAGDCLEILEWQKKIYKYITE